jgi:site-specific DNA recombinase
MRALIEQIDLYPEKPNDGCWIRKIVFNFPIPINGEQVQEFPLEKPNNVRDGLLSAPPLEGSHIRVMHTEAYRQKGCRKAAAETRKQAAETDCRSAGRKT